MHTRRLSILFVALFGACAATCSRPSLPVEISRDRAIEIARGQVTFQISSVTAQKTSSAGRALWIVTIRGRLPGQPAELFETRIVEIDRVTGAVVSIARS
jgi:hypothetical protein